MLSATLKEAYLHFSLCLPGIKYNESSLTMANEDVRQTWAASDTWARKIVVLHFKMLTAAVTALVLLLLWKYTAWDRREKASAGADGATNLPWNFCSLKFEEKKVLVTWPIWCHHDVTLPWFFLTHILLLLKNQYFHVIMPFMSQTWHENTRSTKLAGNFF